MERTGSFGAAVKGGGPMTLLRILVWSKWPNVISPTEDDNYLGVRLLFAKERSKKKANSEEGGMKITEEKVEVGILLNNR